MQEMSQASDDSIFVGRRVGDERFDLRGRDGDEGVDRGYPPLQYYLLSYNALLHLRVFGLVVIIGWTRSACTAA